MVNYLRKIKDYYLINHSGLFDEKYYCLQNPDVRRADVNPLWHFVGIGWKEGRNPSHDFDVNYYLSTYPDVLSSGINPLNHYLKFGRKEGRNPLPQGTKKSALRKATHQPQPLVTVVVVTYNGKDTIAETLQGVFSQTYENIEIVIVDDGSQDNTVQLCKTLAPKANVHIIKNSGTMAARAFGATLASGEFLFFLDQDDLLFPDCIQKEMDFLLDNPNYGLACGNMACIDEEGEELGFNVIPNPSPNAYFWENLLNLYPLALSTTLINTNLYFEIGGWDSRFVFSGALGDTDFFVRVAEISKICFLPENLGKYRWSENRPGRLRSFIYNLAEYAKKYSDHPRLKGIQGASLRQKFIQTCVNYGNHIFDLILQQEKSVSMDLFKYQKSFYESMKTAFGLDLERATGITPITADFYNLDYPLVRTILYKYQMNREWQSLFRTVALGDPGQFLDWLKSKIPNNKDSKDFEFLREQIIQLMQLDNYCFLSSRKNFSMPNCGSSSDPTIVLLYSGSQDILARSINVLRSLEVKFSKILIIGDQANLLNISEGYIHCIEYKGNLFETLKSKQEELQLTSDVINVLSDTFMIKGDSLNELNGLVKAQHSHKLVFGKIVLSRTLEALSPVAITCNSSTIVSESSPYCFSGLAYSRKSKVASIGYCAFSKRLLETDFFDKVKISGNYLVSKEELFVYQPNAIVLDTNQPKEITSAVIENSLSANWLRITPELKILCIDDYIPAIQLGSGFPREQEMLLTLKKLEYFVTFYPVGNPLPFEPDTTMLQDAGVEVFHSNLLDFTDLLELRKNFYDIVIISRPHVFSKYIDLVRKYQENAKVIYDAEALFYKREKAKQVALGETQNDLIINSAEKEELELMAKADLVISVSEKERDTIQIKRPDLAVGVWGHKQNLQASLLNFEERRDILFFGSFVAGPGSPNEDALFFFAKEIFPTLKRELGCKLFVVGSSPTPGVLDLASPEIIITGFVKDPSEYFNKCRVSVIPTRFAAGIPLKLIETFSFGLPTIVTDLIADQLQLQDGFHVLIAKDAREFIEKTIILYKTKWLWNQLWHNSREYLNANYSEEVMTNRLTELIDAVMVKTNLESNS